MLIFTYGTLMSGFGNNRLLNGSEGYRECTLIGPAKTARTFFMRHVGFPVIRACNGIDDDGTYITGEVWDIGDPETDPASADVLLRMDRLEGVSRSRNPEHGMYMRVEYLVLVDGETEPRKVCLYESTAGMWAAQKGAFEIKDGDWRKLVRR